MKYLKERWEILLGFFIAIIGTLFLSNRNQNKTNKKLNDLDKDKNKKINEISERKNKAHEKIIRNHAKTFQELADREISEIESNKEKTKKHKDTLESMSNEELAELFNKE